MTRRGMPSLTVMVAAMVIVASAAAAAAEVTESRGGRPQLAPTGQAVVAAPGNSPVSAATLPPPPPPPPPRGEDVVKPTLAAAGTAGNATLTKDVGDKPTAAASRDKTVGKTGNKGPGLGAKRLAGPGAGAGPADREDVEEEGTRSPKLDVEWVVPPRRPTVVVVDADAEVLNYTLPTEPTTPSTTSSTTPSTTTSTTTTTTTTPPPPTTTTTTTPMPTTPTTTTPTTTTPTTTTPTTTTPTTTTPTTTTTSSKAPPPATNATTAVPAPPPPPPPPPASSSSPRPIVPKCCPPGQRVLSEKKKCVESPLEFIPPFVEYEEELPEAAIDGSLQYQDEDAGDSYPEETIITEAEGYDIIVGNPCRYGRFRLEPQMDSRDEFYLMANGSLVAPFLFEQPLGSDEFCMDVFPDTDNGDVVVLPLVCFPPPDGPKRTGLQFILYPIGLLLSVPFLVTTFVLYAMTPSLCDVHGKALMCQVSCLTVAYLTLAFVQLWGAHLNRNLCFATACIVQFSFVACFLWLNVMCINTWYNMGWRPARKWCRRTERRRFVLYSMYAWALPCVLLGVTLVMDLTPTIPSSYVKPRFGVDFCWFQTDRAALPYFYAPVTFLVVVNVVLFVLTACAVHHRRRKRALNASATPLTDDTCYQRHSSTAFRSCVLLFGAMGLNWVMEVVSFYVGGPSYIWYATDALNCLQGVWTFFIFVLLNRPARQEIRARIVLLRSLRAEKRDVELRLPDEPQIDDFTTVVNRQSRLRTNLSPHWQQEIRGIASAGAGYKKDQQGLGDEDADDGERQALRTTATEE